MSLKLLQTLGPRILKEPIIGCLSPSLQNLQTEQLRYRKTKHWNPKFKELRRLKVAKIKLPNYNEDFKKLSEEEVRTKFKEQGISPPRPWIEKQFFLCSTGSVFEPYVPPEGDGKISPLSAQGAKQKLQFLEKKTKTMMALRKVRQYQDDFDTPQFCKSAEEIYIKAHEYLAAADTENIIDYVTERAYPEVIHNIKNKTIKWKFLKKIELPYVVHARCTDIITKENIFAQVTVRFHTQQILAVYDRFGRLMHGSEILAKDVLEYVVFEMHLANEYGRWRIHDKIIPDWLPPKEPSVLTYKKLKAPVDDKREDVGLVEDKLDKKQESVREIATT